LAQHLLGRAQVLEDIQEQDGIEATPSEGYGEIDLLDVGDEHVFTKSPGAIGGGRVDLDPPNPAAPRPQRFRNAATGGSDIQHVTSGWHRQNAEGVRIIEVGQIDGSGVAGETHRG
jgi:hypothetical protein